MAIIRAHEMGVKQKAATSINVEELQELFKDMNSDLRNGRLSSAQAVLKRMITVLPGLKKSANVLINTIVSVREGLASKEITKKTATEDLKSGIAEFQEALDAIIESVDVSDSSEEQVIDDLPSLLKDQLTPYDSSANEIQVKLNKNGVFVGYAPVLPLCKPPLSKEALKKNAFPFKDFGGYLILEKQLVVGFSNDYIRQHLNKKDKEATLLEEMLDTVKAKYRNMKLVEVGGLSGWYGAKWYWLLPESQLRLLRKSTIAGPNSSSFSVSKWSFPFFRSGAK